MNQDDDKKQPASKIPAKIALLLGSGLTILSGTPAVNAAPNTTSLSPETDSVLSVTNERTAPKLVLKPASNGDLLLAQHDSHSSHDSHASHASHTSGGF